MKNREQIILQFAAAIMDCFKEEEKRESFAFPPISLENSLQDVMLAMFFAMQYVINKMADEEYDPLDFINVLNHALYDDAMNESEEGEITNEKSSSDGQ